MLSRRLSVLGTGPLRTFCTEAAAAEKPAYKPGRKKFRWRRPCVIQQRERNADLSVRAEVSNLPWRMMGATILHRYPTITRDVPQWKQDLIELQESDIMKKQEVLMEMIKGTPAQLIPDANPTYEEILESMPFKPASRITEADEKNDRRSVNRRLQDSLFLIVKRNRATNAWQFPQGKLQPDENFRQASERVITRAVGNVDNYFISNAPCGHFMYEYPPALQKARGNFGAKVFFYRAQLIKGNIKLETRLYTDYAWIARDEVGEYFDKDTAEYLSDLLPW